MRKNDTLIPGCLYRLGLLILTCMLLGGCRRERGPVFEPVTEAVTELGQIKVSGKPCVRNIRFRNSGDAPLKLKGVRSDCACAPVEWDLSRVIRPGEEAEIGVSFELEPVARFKRTVIVWAEGAEPNMFAFHFVGSAYADLYWQPQHLTVFVENGAERKTSLRLFSKEPGFKASAVYSDLENVEFAIRDPEKEGREQSIDITAGATGGSLSRRGKIVVTTNMEGFEKLEIPVLIRESRASGV